MGRHGSHGRIGRVNHEILQSRNFKAVACFGMLDLHHRFTLVIEIMGSDCRTRRQLWRRRIKVVHVVHDHIAHINFEIGLGDQLLLGAHQRAGGALLRGLMQ